MQNNISMWITLVVVLVIASPFVGYYLDYRDRPKLFTAWIKDWIRGYLPMAGWLIVLLLLATFLAKFVAWKI